MVTDKMVEAAVEEYAAHSEVSYPTDGIAMRAALEAALSASDAEPLGWIWKSDIAERWQFVSGLEKPSLGFTPSFEARVQYLRVYAAPPAVAVKALEWTDEECPDAKCTLGHYVINPYYRMVELIIGYGGFSQISRARIQLGKDASDAELKAAAQADYEARIRTALVSPADTSPVIPEGWQLVPKVATAEMEDAAKRFVRPYHDIQPSDWTSMVPKDFFRLAWKAMLASAPKEASHDD